MERNKIKSTNVVFVARTEINCTMREYGELIETPVSRISRAEAGSATLSMEASNFTAKLFELSMALPPSEEEALEIPEEETAELLENLRYRNDRIVPELQELRIAHENLLARYKAADRAFRLLTSIEESNGPFSRQLLYRVGEMKAKQVALMKKCNESVRHTIRVKIAQLEAEMKLNKSILEGV